STSITAILAQSASASLTVITLKGVDSSGTYGAGAIGAIKAANGSKTAPSTSLTTTRTGSWVLAVGNDWDGATARTLGSNQTLVHQFLATASSDTFWTQRLTNAVPASGTTVVINDTAPTNHRWNLALVEVLVQLTADT